MPKTQTAPRPDTKIAKVLEILSDGKPHSTFEIVRRAYNQHHASVARIGAIIFDLRERYGMAIVGEHSKKNRTKYWYIMGRPHLVWSEAELAIAKADEVAGEWE